MKAVSPEILKTLNNLPSEPGVYIFRDRSGRVIYVGKAKNLRSRVRSYFQESSGDSRLSFPLLVQKIERIETILTPDETSALLLEESLIKEHCPRYNLRLRDDKSYLFLRLRTDHPFPYLEVIRRPRDGSFPTFGPYASSVTVRQLLAVLREYFPLRTCSNYKFSHRSRPCLDHFIGRCPAPCVGKISQDAYRLLVYSALDFLKGDRQKIIATLRAEMERLSEELRFEDAVILRDRLRALTENQEGSPIVRVGRESSDTWGVQVAEDRFSAVVLRVVDGKVVHLDPFPGLRRHGFELPLDQLLLQYYTTAESLPAVILLDPRYRESVMASSLERILSERRGKKVEIRFPERGEERELLKMAERNARELLETRVRGDDLHAATALMHLLHLPKVPEVIECYDISHHQGADPVGVQVTFIRGFEEISRRRYYKLTQTADSLDPLGDPQWMAELLERRLRRGIEEGDLPDLIILDGGKAQLSLVQRVYQKLEIEWSRVPVVALAKARPGEESASPIAREERLYLPGRKNPILLKRSHPSYSLVVHLRDTTHRAVLSFHRHTYRSSLILGIERIPGIGPRRRQRLHQAFPNLRIILQTPETEVSRMTGIPLPVVMRVRAWLERNAEEVFVIGTQGREGQRSSG